LSTCSCARSNRHCVSGTEASISALYFDQSVPAQAFFAVHRTGEVLASAEVLVGLENAVRRERFQHYVGEEERGHFLRSLLQEARLVEIREKIRACRDPEEDKFLELATNGGANCMVSVMAARLRSILSGAFASLRRTPFWKFIESRGLIFNRRKSCELRLE
jgi:putative PIN family toxin of toxin-antitoxin system